MNFFDGYGKEKKASSRNKLIVAGVALVVIAVLAVISLNLISRRNAADLLTAELTATLAATEGTRAELEAAMLVVDARQGIFDALEAIDMTLGNISFFTADDFRTIVEAFPEGATANIIAISPPSIGILGVLDELATLPSLMQNLEDTDLFASVLPAGAVRDLTVPEGEPPIILILAPTSLATSVSVPGFSADMLGEGHPFAIECTLKGVMLS